MLLKQILLLTFFRLTRYDNGIAENIVIIYIPSGGRFRLCISDPMHIAHVAKL